MNRKTAMITMFVSCFLIVLTSIIVIATTGKQSIEIAPQSQGYESAGFSASSVRETAVSYILREHEGKIAVFRWGEDIPISVYDVSVRNLSEYDQDSLKSGIVVKSELDLALLIEDYTS